MEITSLEKKGLGKNEFEETDLVRLGVGSIDLTKTEFAKINMLVLTMATSAATRLPNPLAQQYASNLAIQNFMKMCKRARNAVKSMLW